MKFCNILLETTIKLDQDNRATPVELINERTRYDEKRYIELLTETCNSVIEPFGLQLLSDLRQLTFLNDS